MKRQHLIALFAIFFTLGYMLICFQGNSSDIVQGHDTEISTKSRQDVIAPESSELLLESAVRATDLIKETVEPNKNFSLEFLLRKKDNGAMFKIELPRTWYLDDEEDDYLGNFSDQVVFDLVESKNIKRVYESGDEARVVGIIIRWVPKDDVLSVCDIENNGAWDYVCDGGLFFTDNPDQMIASPTGKKLPIGSTDSKNCRLVPLDKKGKQVDFTSLQHLISRNS